MNETDTKTILLTGGTGAFGEYLIHKLFTLKNINLILLIRATSDEAAFERVKDSILDVQENVKVFAADLEQENFGLSADNQAYIAEKTTHILHAAASTRFTLPIAIARERNVETTRRMLHFAKNCSNLERFGYVSSALVAGKRTGLILEDDFEHNAGFINTYEESKYEAESLVRKTMQSMPIVIFRPPLVVSKPRADYQGPVNLLSHSLRLLEKDYLPLLPGSKESVFDIVDGAATAHAIIDLLLKDTLHYQTYHIANGTNSLTAGDILEMLEAHIGRKIRVTFAGDMVSFRKKLRWIILFRPWLHIVYKKTASYLPELAYSKTFSNEHFFKEFNIKNFGPAPADVFRSILE